MLAQEAHIDAFALNVATQDKGYEDTLKIAFQTANELGFKLFFSFDYAASTPWDRGTVLNILKEYISNPAYFLYKSQPLVSTFEGWQNSDDWISLKSATNCLFMPDWSSLGAKPALQRSSGVADGLLSWAAWPWGNTDMDTYVS